MTMQPFNADGGFSTTGNVTANSLVGQQGNISVVADTSTWTFDTTGNLTLPGNTFTINYANGTQVPIVAPSSLVNGDNSFALDADGNVIFQGADPGQGINRGMEWDYGANVDGVNSTVRQDNAGLTVRAWTENGGGGVYSAPVNIVTNQDANVNTWIFDGSGNLTLPGDLRLAAGNIQSNVISPAFASAVTGITTGVANVVVTIANEIFEGPFSGTVTISGVTGTTEANGVWGYQAVDFDQFQLFTDATLTTPVNGTTWTTYISGGTAVGVGSYENLSIQGGNISISGNDNTWTFDAAGNLTLPSNISSINYANGQPYGAGGGGVASLPLANGTSNFNIATVNGNATVTTAGTQTWIFDTTGNLTIPNDIVSTTTIDIDNRLSGNTADIRLYSADDITLQARDRDVGSVVEGGDINIYAGRSAQDSDSSGGDINIYAGDGGASNVDYGGAGGTVRLEAGQGGAASLSDPTFGASSGGSLTLQAGAGGDNSGNVDLGAQGGDVYIYSGSSTGNTNSGGDIILTTGSGGANGAAGNVQVVIPSSALGVGGTWNFNYSGNLTLPSNGNIDGADGAFVRFQSLEEGVSRSSVTLHPGDGLMRLESWDNEISQSFTSADWTSGEYIAGGIAGQIAFVDAPTILNLVNTIETSRLFLQVNGGAFMPYQGYGSAGNNITFEVLTAPAVSPETVTDFVMAWSPRSRIEMDYDEGEMNLIARNLDIRITGDQDVDLQSSDRLRIENSSNINGITISTDTANTFMTWEFGVDGTLTVPSEGIIQSLNDTVILQSKDTGTGNVFKARLGTNGGLFFETTEYSQGWLSLTNFNGSANISAGTPTSTGFGGYNLNFQAGDSDPVTWNSNPGGNINIAGGYGSFGDGGGGPGGQVNIVGGASSDSHSGNVNIASGANKWVFDYAGATYIAGNIGSTSNTFPFSTTVANVQTGSTVYVDLNDPVFAGVVTGGQVTIAGVVGTSEVNGTWWYYKTDDTQFALYTDNTFTTPVDGSSWGTYVSGGTSVGATYGPLTVNAGITQWVFNADSTLSGNVANISLGAVSIGAGAGWNGNPAQGSNAIAIGWNAGAGDNSGQGQNAIAIGSDDVGFDQGANSIAIGHQAGWADGSPMGENAIAIGTAAGYDVAVANSIIINATGDVLNSTNSGFYVAPVRNDTGNTVNTLYWNDTTKEITYANGYGDANVSVYLASGTNTANIITTGNISGGNSISTTGNSYAQYFIGDGSLLTGIAPTVQVYAFANTISTGGYYEAAWLSNYVAGPLANVSATANTTPTNIASFITEPGYPNITVIPSGTILVRMETTKDTGPQGYYCYAEIYKRAAGGTETLLVTTDSTSVITQNNTVQQNLLAYVTTPISLLSTDQIVAKVYAVMISGTATITLSFDDNTGSGLQLPALPASTANFVPYNGATDNINLDTYSLTTTGNVSGGNIISTTAVVSGGNITATGNIASGNVISTSNIRVGGQIQSTAVSGGNIIWATANQTDFQGSIRLGGSGVIKSPTGATSITLNSNGANIGILGVTNGVNATSTTSGALIVTGGAGITGNVYVGRNLVVTPFVFSGLPATPAVGTRSFITDGNLVASGNFGAQVSGGGSNAVPVWSDGTNWYIG